MHPKLQILLPDCNLRKCFDVFNCLSHLGYFVVPAAEKPSFGVGLLYGRKVFRLRKSDFASFTNDLNEIMHHFSGYRIVFLPTEEDTVLLFMEYIDQYGKGSFVFALPDRNSFELVRNKRSLSRYCHSVNISCPKELNVNDLNRNFCRAIAKPCIGSGGRGHVHIDRLSDLESIREIENDFIIQELLPDFRHVQGGFFLFDKGKLVSYYGHIRLRTFPISAGVTVFSKIVYSKQIKNLGNDLLQRLNWNGLAMIEFLFNPTTKEYDVIEVNPRLWGSFLLSEFAETGFLSNYIRISLGEPPIQFYPKTDSKIRWFFPYDLLNYIAAKGRIKDFWKLNKVQTCYVGFTYSEITRSLFFLAFSLFDIQNLKKFISKLL